MMLGAVYMGGVIGAHFGRMRLETIRMDVIANNIANVETTRTSEGGAFKRSDVVVDLFARRSMESGRMGANIQQRSASIFRVQEDRSPGQLQWDPMHPDAITSGKTAGYVELSNVNVSNEMTHFIAAARAYDRSATLLESMGFYVK